MAHCARGYFMKLFCTPPLERKAEESLAAARTLAEKGATERETRHIAALEAWCRGDIAAATAGWEDILLGHPRDVLALRLVQGVFAGYGSLSVAMAAESAPRDRMPSAIGLVQTAQRLGPGIGPVIGGVLAGLVGLRRAFIVTALFYAVGMVIVWVMYDERVAARGRHAADADGVTDRVSMRTVLTGAPSLLTSVAEPSIWKTLDRGARAHWFALTSARPLARTPTAPGPK